MILKDYLDKLIPSDRLLVVDKDGNELFRGYGTQGKYVHADLNAEILGIGITTETFEKGKSADSERAERLKAVDPDNDYRHNNIEVRVYNKVTVAAGDSNDNRT